MKRYDLENYEDSLSIMDVAIDGEWVDYHDAVEAIQQARKDTAREIVTQLNSDLEYGQTWIVDKIKSKFGLVG